MMRRSHRGCKKLAGWSVGARTLVAIAEGVDRFAQGERSCETKLFVGDNNS
jgi:hypothetical protein